MRKENQVIVGPGGPGNPIMSENATPDRTGPADTPDPPLTTETLVALAHAHRQGIPYETRKHLLQHLPERLRALSDLVLGGKMNAEEIAYALAALLDGLENAPGATGSHRH